MKGSNILKLVVIFFLEKIVYGDIKNYFVISNDQLVDIFTKSLWGPRIDYICKKFCMYHLYTPAWEGVLDVTGLVHTFYMFLIYKYITLCLLYTRDWSYTSFLLYFHSFNCMVKNIHCCILQNSE